MCAGCHEAPHEAVPAGAIGRRDFLRLGGAGLAGVVLLGTAGGRVLAQAGSSLEAEFGAAATEYGVPQELLLAMGYVNTLWEMPPPDASDYVEDDLHGRGAYGVMQLVRNPVRDTLGRAAALTGLSVEELKNSRAANVRGGAAVLADIQGANRPAELDGWREAVASYGDTELYALEVYETLKSGASATISTGESLQLSPQDVELPQIELAGKADYRHATWYGASDNFTNSNRGAKDIDIIVVHVAQGSYSGTISWFDKPRSNVSAHYVVNRNGKVAQCVRNENIAWHAGDWPYNRRSIGIEHAGYASEPRTARQYRASARLSAYLSRRFGIPVDRRHVIGHRDVPGVNRTCPGKFDFSRYLRLIKHYR
jgi:N-acetylmuramoyl-L-alanine amidase